MSEQTIFTNLSPARILVVDDRPSIVLTLVRAITHLGSGIKVVSATNGREALEKAKDGALDLLITDMLMPDMSGLRLIENLKSHSGGYAMFTILITAYDMPGLRESARRIMVDKTLIKPIRPEVICQIVEEALTSMESSNPSQKETEL